MNDHDKAYRNANNKMQESYGKQLKQQLGFKEKYSEVEEFNETLKHYFDDLIW
jgi:hypothetical protein